MKKLLALILAAILLAASLASCAVSPAEPANIRATSSDAASAIEWLESRLGENIPDRLAIGTGDGGLGVDLSALEDDGYVIRVLGDEIALLARTTDGLDRAVRRYAKAVEAGEIIADETFHEGYRIEKLILAGNDISTFAIRVDCENEYVRDWARDEVADTLSRLLGIACGFAPEVGGEAEHYIVLRHVSNDDFKESSYNYHFEDGDLVIEFVEIYGAVNGAMLFLENECGWTDLLIGLDVLAESDLVDIPADLDVTVHPTFSGGFCQCIRNPYATLRKINSGFLDRGYKIASAHHALGTTWASDYGLKMTNHFPCLTDDYVYEDTVEEIVAHVEARLAAGEKLGDAMAHIDLGMEDGDASVGATFCKCKDCQAVYLEEGATWAGPMIRFANRIEEAVDAAGYDGIKYSVFAYAGSNMPPRKTAPNDDIYVTIVMHDSCDKHFVDGSQCDGNAANKFMIEWVRSYSHGQTYVNNNDWRQWIEDWDALGAHIYMRTATLSNPGNPFMTMYIIYENMRFFAEHNVMAIYNESYAIGGLDFNYLVGELYQICHYYPGLSRAEYYAEFDRLLEKYYGEGWRDIRFVTDALREAELATSCTCAWGGGAPHFDNAAIDAKWDEMDRRVDSAARLASNAQEEFFCNMVKVIVTRLGCLAAYSLYGVESERFALARTRWRDMIAVLADAGFPIIDASEIAYSGYVGGLRERTGNVIYFPLEKIGVWPYAYRIEPTLDAYVGIPVSDEVLY